MCGLLRSVIFYPSIVLTAQLHYLLQLELKERFVYLASGYKDLIRKCGEIGYDVFGNMFTENGMLGGVICAGWCTVPPTSSRIDICATQFYSQQLLKAVMPHLYLFCKTNRKCVPIRREILKRV
jgi:hypothetical protein